MFSMIMEYLDVNKIDQGMLLAGYLGENLIYEKRRKGKWIKEYME